MAIVDRVRELVEPLVDAASVQLYDVEHNGGTVRVLVDDPDGLDLSVIAGLSRSIALALDEHDPIPGRYTLEVSSPGLERPLRTVDHFRDAIGSDVKIKTRPDYDGPRRLTGVIVDSDEHSVRVRADTDEVETVDIADISSARTVFTWGPGPKAGGQRRPADRSEASEPEGADSDRSDTSESEREATSS
jgi:ribosome maturation factor RimP